MTLEWFYDMWDSVKEFLIHLVALLSFLWTITRPEDDTTL